jgi:WD40 repeat protein
VWSLDSGDCLRSLSGHTKDVNSVCVSPDGKYVVSGSDDKTVRVWSLDSGDCLRTLSDHTDWVMSVCVSLLFIYVINNFLRKYRHGKTGM